MSGVPRQPKKRRRGIVKEKLPPFPENRHLPLVVFANGSTLPSTSDWVLRWKRMVGDALNAIEVITFDYPDISAEKHKGFSKVKRLFDYHWEFLEDSILKHPGYPLVLMGTSMGSRINSMIAWYEHFNITAIVCLGYPLKTKNGRLSEGPINQDTRPTIFVQGSQDPFCPYKQLKYTGGVIESQMNRLHVVRGGDQFLQIDKGFLELHKTTQEDAEREAVKEIAHFVSSSINEYWKYDFDKPIFREIAFGLSSDKIEKRRFHSDTDYSDID